MYSRYGRSLLVTSLLLALLILAACVAPAPVAAPASTPAAQSTEQPAAGTKDIVTWYYYDQNNSDPAANEHIGNFYLAETMPKFNQQFAGKYNWVNVPRDNNLVL